MTMRPSGKSWEATSSGCSAKRCGADPSDSVDCWTECGSTPSPRAPAEWRRRQQTEICTGSRRGGIEALVRLHVRLRDAALAVRQDHLHVARRRRPQADMDARLLARCVAIADGDLRRPQQGCLLAELARLVDVDARADALTVDALRALHLHLQPVPRFRLVLQQQRGTVHPPVCQEEIEPAVAVEVGARPRRHVDALAFPLQLVEEL